MKKQRKARTKPSVVVSVRQTLVLGPVHFVLYMSPLSDVISCHAMSNVSFVDDTQFYQSAPFTKLVGLLTRIQE